MTYAIAHLIDYGYVYILWEVKIHVSLYCDICFIVVWNQIHNVSKVCLYMILAGVIR